MSKPSWFSPENPMYPILILANVIITSFLAVTSSVATIIADSAIQGEIALSDTQAIWITTLYFLGINTTVPTATWFANRFGNKQMYTYGVLIFTLGSTLVGFANNFTILAASRFIEGVGGGFIFPIGLGLIAQTLSKEKVTLGLNLYIGGAFGCGLGLGIPLSGYLTQFHSWRMFFWAIIPLGIIAAFSCWHSREKTVKPADTPFDYWGFLTFASFIASLLIALTLGPIKSTDEGWRSWYILALFAFAAICLTLTILIEKKHSHPLIPLPLFKDPLFSICVIAMFLLGMSLFASVSVSINYMLNALSYEKYVTGKIAAIYGISMALFSVISNRLIKLIPVPILTFVGLSCLVWSYFLNNELSWLTGVEQIYWILLLRGIGIGLALGPTTLLALYIVPQELKSSAATLLTFFRQVGGTYGGTLIAIFSIRQTIFHTARFGEQASSQLPAYKMTFQNLYNKFPDPAQAKAAIIKNIAIQAYIQGLNDALIVFGYVTGTVAILLIVFTLVRQWKAKNT